MSRYVSTNEMVSRLGGMLGTNDLTAWEHGFVMKLVKLKDENKLVTMTSAQVEALDNLHSKHFA